MDTTNLIILIVVLVSFVVIVTLMIRRSMNYTEDLREELKSGFKIPTDVKRDSPSRKDIRTSNSRFLYFVTSIVYVTMLWSSVDFVDVFGLIVLYLISIGIIRVNDFIDTIKDMERANLLKRHPLPHETIDSLDSYLSFIEREGVTSHNIRSVPYQLSEDVCNDKRDIVIDIGFIERERVPYELAEEIRSFKSRFDYGFKRSLYRTGSFTRTFFLVVLIMVIGLLLSDR